MLMSPNKGETGVHGCHCQGDMAVRMREVLARPWVGVCVPLALSLSYAKRWRGGNKEKGTEREPLIISFTTLPR